MGFLGTFTTDTSGQLDILGHDGDTLGMDGAQVGIFKLDVIKVTENCFQVANLFSFEIIFRISHNLWI